MGVFRYCQLCLEEFIQVWIIIRNSLVNIEKLYSPILWQFYILDSVIT